MISTVPTAAAGPAADSWWLRLHRGLMPDYNRKAAAYWWVMVLLGAAFLAHTLRTLLALPANELRQVSSLIAVSMLAGFFPVRIPRSNNSFAAGEIFIFLLLLLYGPAAAALAATGEGLIGSWRTSKRWTSRIVSPAMACMAMFIVGTLLQVLRTAAHDAGLNSPAMLLMATMLCSVLYFMLNTVLITAVPHLKRSQWPGLRDVFGSFGWIGITFAGSASIAGLLFLAFEQAGVGVLFAATPIIAMLLATMHYYFREQAAEDLVRTSRVEAAEREAALAVQHMRALEVSEQRFHSAFTHASIGMALVGFDGRVVQVNAVLQRLLGVAAEDSVAGRPFGEFVDAEDASTLTDRLMQLKAQRMTSFEVELRLRHRTGAEIWVALHGGLFSEQGATAPCLILQVQDVTARRMAEAGLKHIAYHDSLTGLPNRRRFLEQLTQSLGRVGQDPRRHFGLLFLDFDRFKVVNDSLGHAVGDEFLVAVARRIQQQVRPHDIVARLGGDEFAIIAEDVDCARYAVALADRLHETLCQPLQIDGNEITSSVSIGITFSNMGYTTPTDMVRDADTAMYKAKAAGKGRYVVFDSALHTEVSRRMLLEGDLRRALAAGQLSVAYQPLYDLGSGRVSGFEALARWDHPELGPVGPATFIPIAEEVGLMTGLTDFVLRTACRQMREWQLRDDCFAQLNMHVNLSGSDLAQPKLVERVQSVLVETGLQAQHLTLELTENILMERLEAALPQLEELRRLGLGLSVDDFGTGYSSLQHLSTLPVNSLKIDRAFVSGMELGSNKAAIVRGIVLLGNSLGKSIIAEGIESESELDQLYDMGCASGQGFHLSRPLAAELIDKMLEGLVAQTPTAPSARRPGHAALLH
jgi:diguanylate cyclase (GGDEF)-like protein/PAS domain S-box-containing protein